jgi:hypothetical protein
MGAVMKRTFAAALFALLTVTAPAHAALITDTIDFTASDFQSNNPAVSPPIDPLKGSFTFTYDPTVASPDPTTAGFTLHSLTLANLAYPTAFDYTGSGADLLVGSFHNNSGGFFPGHNSFFLELAGLHDNNPTFFAAFYSIDGLTGTYFGTNTGTVDLVSQTVQNPVPLPPALPLFGSGVMMLAGVAWRKKRGEVS